MSFNNTVFEDVEQVSAHVENCCEAHGCKWGRHDCPVTSHAVKQAYPCDECDKLADSLADRWW